jgi:hypothetical protein
MGDGAGAVTQQPTSQAKIWLFEKGKRYLILYHGKEIDRGRERGPRVSDYEFSRDYPKLTGFTVDLFDVGNPDSPKPTGKYDGFLFKQHGSKDNPTGVGNASSCSMVF